MHILVLGATGFIGRHITSVLLAAGHRVTGAGRRTDELARAFPGLDTRKIDLSTATESSWQAALKEVDIVVNVAGQLNRDLSAVHVDGPTRLYRAAAANGIRRVVLVSAISARPEVDTAYTRTKLAGEESLRQSGVPWTILRPSLVVAADSFGGTSVLRGLAGLPALSPDLPGSQARFTPIHARDLGKVVHQVIEDDRFAGQVLEPAGAQSLTFEELVAAYRGWLGFATGYRLRVPAALMRLAGAVGEHFGGPISTTALRQLEAGNGGDPEGVAAALGWTPRGLAEILRDEPSGVQDRWHARLFFIAIAVRLSLALLWIGSALAGLFFGNEMALQFVGALGLPAQVAPALVVGTALLDLTIAGLLLTRHSRIAGVAQFVLVLLYTVGLTIALPGLWTDPFGALLKNLPILALVAVNAVLSEPR